MVECVTFRFLVVPRSGEAPCEGISEESDQERKTTGLKGIWEERFRELAPAAYLVGLIGFSGLVTGNPFG